MNARLAAIGPYEVSYVGRTLAVGWDEPAGLDCEWTRFGLSFNVGLDKKPDPSRASAALDALCDERDRLAARWPEPSAELRQYLLDFFRGAVAKHLPAATLAAYCEGGKITDKKILRAVKAGTISLTHSFDSPVQIESHFRVDWDDDEGVEVQFDADGKIVRGF